jgi:hypothetical protein
MPSISTCPKCAEQVTVPDGLAESAAVRCPVCDAEYPVDDVTEPTAETDDANDDLPPELIPVEPSLETEPDSADKETGPLVKCPCCDAQFGLGEVIVVATGEELGSEAAAAIGPDGSVTSNHDEPEESTFAVAIDTGIGPPPAASGAFDFEDNEADRRDGALAIAASAAGVRRRRDGEKHPLRLIVEVVLGGVAGLAITYYGLNFFGGPRFDWFEVYLPGVAHTVEQRPEWWPSISGQSDTSQADEEPMPTPVEPSGPVDEEAADSLLPVEMLPEKPPMEEPPQEPAEEPSEEPADESKGDPPPPPPVGPTDPPSFTSDEFGQVLKTAHNAFTADALSDETYRRLCQLAQTVTFVELADGGPKLRNRLEAVDILLRKIGSEELNLIKIGEMAASLAYDQERTDNGILLAGTVESSLKLGQAHGASVQLAGTDSPLVVLSETPMPAKVGDRVLVLGSVIDKPAEKMVGVDTSMSRVIWSRMTVNLGR